jgi:hypothetical protein
MLRNELLKLLCSCSWVLAPGSFSRPASSRSAVNERIEDRLRCGHDQSTQRNTAEHCEILPELFLPVSCLCSMLPLLLSLWLMTRESELLLNPGRCCISYGAVHLLSKRQ